MVHSCGVRFTLWSEVHPVKHGSHCGVMFTLWSMVHTVERGSLCGMEGSCHTSCFLQNRYPSMLILIIDKGSNMPDIISVPNCLSHIYCLSVYLTFIAFLSFIFYPFVSCLFAFQSFVFSLSLFYSVMFCCDVCKTPSYLLTCVYLALGPVDFPLWCWSQSAIYFLSIFNEDLDVNSLGYNLFPTSCKH